MKINYLLSFLLILFSWGFSANYQTQNLLKKFMSYPRLTVCVPRLVNIPATGENVVGGIAEEAELQDTVIALYTIQTNILLSTTNYLAQEIDYWKKKLKTNIFPEGIFVIYYDLDYKFYRDYLLQIFQNKSQPKNERLQDSLEMLEIQALEKEESISQSVVLVYRVSIKPISKQNSTYSWYEDFFAHSFSYLAYDRAKGLKNELSSIWFGEDVLAFSLDAPHFGVERVRRKSIEKIYGDVQKHKRTLNARKIVQESLYKIKDLRLNLFAGVGVGMFVGPSFPMYNILSNSMPFFFTDKAKYTDFHFILNSYADIRIFDTFLIGGNYNYQFSFYDKSEEYDDIGKVNASFVSTIRMYSLSLGLISGETDDENAFSIIRFAPAYVVGNLDYGYSTGKEGTNVVHRAEGNGYALTLSWEILGTPERRTKIPVWSFGVKFFGTYVDIPRFRTKENQYFFYQKNNDKYVFYIADENHVLGNSSYLGLRQTRFGMEINIGFAW